MLKEFSLRQISNELATQYWRQFGIVILLSNSLEVVLTGAAAVVGESNPDTLITEKQALEILDNVITIKREGKNLAALVMTALTTDSSPLTSYI